jgi:hypothetical protein
LSKWTKEICRKNWDRKKIKISNHSHRASAVPTLTKKGVGEQQLVKLTGHSSSSLSKPYLQLDSDLHYKLIESLRDTSSSSTIQSEIHQNVCQK